MNHYLLVRKKWSSLEKNIVLSEEIVEAEDFDIKDGCVVLFVYVPRFEGDPERERKNIVSAPAGAWTQCEKVEVGERAESLLVTN